jgi:hypothetical protein
VVLAFSVGLAAWQLAPLKARKVVTLSHPGGGSTRIEFSAQQTEPEIVYAVRTEYEPRIAAALAAYDGVTLDRPYRDHVAKRVHERWPGWVAAPAVLAVVLLLLALRRRGLSASGSSPRAR